MRRVAGVAAFAFAFALAGCGGSGSGNLSAAMQAKLAPLVENVRRAAESSDPQAAGRALAALQQAVTSSERAHDISPARAAGILTAATDVQQRLALVSSTTTSTTTTTTTAPPPTSTTDTRPAKGDKKGHKGGGGDGGD
jgi:hypothetical protein